MKKILIVSSMQYSKSNRGIDILTLALSKKYKVDHLVFPNHKWKNKGDMVKENINQIYSEFLKLGYKEKLMWFFPKVLTKQFFNYMKKSVDDINFKKYDLIILESGKPLILESLIPENIKLIYRQSDPVELILSKNKYFKELETKVIARSDLFLVVNERIENYYKIKFPELKSKIKLWKNGFDLPEIKSEKKNNSISTPSQAIYIGLFPIDYKLIKHIAKRHSDVNFHIVGPYKKFNSYKNVIFHGYLDQNDYIELIENSDFAFIPYKKSSKLDWITLTSKNYLFMKANLPMISIGYGGLECLKKYGGYVADTKEEFNQKINEIKKRGFHVKYDIELSKFEKSEREKEFIEIIKKII